MDKQKAEFQAVKFFLRLGQCAGLSFLKKYINPSKRESPYTGRLMVPLEKAEGELRPPHTSPVLFIKEDDAWKMFYLADSRPSEVSSLMRVELSSDKIFFSHQIFPRQFCNTIKSDIDPWWLAEHSRKLPSEEKAVFNCNFWMHSHMGKNMARWSNYDNLKIGEMIKGKKFLISVVVVPWGGALRYRCRLDLGEPIYLTVDDVPIFVIKGSGVDREAIKEEMDKEYRDKVIIKQDSLFLYDSDDGFVFGNEPGAVSGANWRRENKDD